jgi:indole-3-glycerol phosphate synthase
LSRFSQAISEGDGISVIPLLGGDVARLASLAEDAGAEAVAVSTVADAERAREQTGLPILVRSGTPREVAECGGHAFVLVFEHVEDEGEALEDLYALARDLDLDCAVDVRDEDELAAALERLDPDIILISEREPDKDEEALERTLDLLPDVPAGKLVISDGPVSVREQVVALERAGVDAILVESDFLAEPGFTATLGELTGR